MTVSTSLSIGTPGRPWGAAEKAQWRAAQTRKRSYADEVLARIEPLRARFDVAPYGHLDYDADQYDLFAVRSRPWDPALPTMLVTGGVHGYETSGVQGALQFLEHHAAAYAGRANLLVVPCVSPWGYERIHRWNPDALGPQPQLPRAQPGRRIGGAAGADRAAARRHRDAHRPARDHRQRRDRVPSRRWPRATASPMCRARSPTASICAPTAPRRRRPSSRRSTPRWPR